MGSMPICKCLGWRFLFAEQREWAQREHPEEMANRETMKVKRVPTERGKRNGINKKDALKAVINIMLAKSISDLQSTRAVTYADSENDRQSPATRLHFPFLTPTSFPNVALSHLRIPPARHGLPDQDPFC